jgi:hypothetical protein
MTETFSPNPYDLFQTFAPVFVPLTWLGMVRSDALDRAGLVLCAAALALISTR